MARALDAATQIEVVTRLIDGEPADAVIAWLVEEGVPTALAATEVARLAAQPGTLVARARARQERAAVLASRLRAALQRAFLRAVPEERALSPERLYGVYVAAHMPVHAPRLAADWPAARWTLPSLAARFGDVEVPVCRGRAAVPEPDRRVAALTVRARLAEVIAEVLSGQGNDLYVLARHHVLRDHLPELVADLRPPPGLLREGWTAAEASLWLGPAGTITPCHHDTCGILFVQLIGRKDVWLAPPDPPPPRAMASGASPEPEVRALAALPELPTGLAATASGYYGAASLADERAREPGGLLAGTPVLKVTLAPGDLLYLPPGWWHEVRALDPSVSVGLTGLRAPTRFDGFTPGFRWPSGSADAAAIGGSEALTRDPR